MLKQTMAPPSQGDAEKKPATLGEMMFGHFILFVACVALPAFFTAVAPISVVTLTRANGSAAVSARISTRLLFLILYKVTTIEEVTAIGDHFVHGGQSERRPGDTRTTRTEDEAFLVIAGTSGEAKVPVSPVNIQNVEEAAGTFLNHPQQRTLKLTVVANWKFGVFAGGILTLFTVFYLYLQLASCLRSLKRLLPG